MQLLAEVQVYVSRLLVIIHEAMEQEMYNQAMYHNEEELIDIESPVIRGFIADGTLTLAQAMDLSYQSFINLVSPAIRGLIAAGTLSLQPSVV